jgi:hypothetical protein
MEKNRSAGDELESGFWVRADEIINLANVQSKNEPRNIVSASLLYAAARFNAFVVTSSANDVSELTTDKNKAIDYFVEQYRRMLTENLDEQIKNFDTYSDR